MDPRAPRHAGGSPNRAGPSALGDALDAPAVAAGSHPDDIAGSGALAKTGVPSQLALDEEEEVIVLGSAAAPAGAHQEDAAVALARQTTGSSSFTEKKGKEQEEQAEVVVADAAARLETTEAGNERFVPIKDVKAMLQTGRLEGQKVAYRTKKDKLNLLNGVIHGTWYFCSCGDCHQNGKALSARAFEQHALKNGHESHNPNDHIVLTSSNISLFEACRKLKEVRNEAIVEATFDIMQNGGHEVVSKKNTEVAANKKFADTNLVQSVRNLEKRMESAEKRMEKIQVQVDTIDKNIDFFCKEMVRYQALFQDLSKIMGKFVDDM